jgi:hypoxanthine phosphoribosyltransferase
VEVGEVGDPNDTVDRHYSEAYAADEGAGASLPSEAARTLGRVQQRETDEPERFKVYRGVVPPRFANAVELECARILDWYGIPWDYEPTTFVLERDEEGRVTRAFTPDFYLPEQDLYVEVTVMKQSLVTRKNRKLRELRERYPGTKIKLFYRRDIERLAQRYQLRIAS